MRLENAGDRRAANAMPDIYEGASDPRAAPRRILFRHPNDQATNLGENTVTPGARLRVVHFRTMSCRCHRKNVSGVSLLGVNALDSWPAAMLLIADR
jgi:hypothetical protein